LEIQNKLFFGFSVLSEFTSQMLDLLYRLFPLDTFLCIPARTILYCRVASTCGPANPWRRCNFRLQDHTNYCSCIRNARDNPCHKDLPGTLFRIVFLFWR